MYRLSAPLDPLLMVAKRVGPSGHAARVQVLRILVKRELLTEARIGLVEGLDPEDVELCLSQDDKTEVMAELLSDPLIADVLSTQVSLDEFAAFSCAKANPAQRMLF